MMPSKWSDMREESHVFEGVMHTGKTCIALVTSINHIKDSQSEPFISIYAKGTTNCNETSKSTTKTQTTTPKLSA